MHIKMDEERDREVLYIRMDGKREIEEVCILGRMEREES